MVTIGIIAVLSIIALIISQRMQDKKAQEAARLRAAAARFTAFTNTIPRYDTTTEVSPNSEGRERSHR